jgi:CRISPR-associated endonuclease Csn1
MARTIGTYKKSAFYKKCVNDDDLWLSCPYCETVFFYLNAELDHIESFFNGGSNYKNNLIPVCQDCNRSKSNKVLHAWLISQSISPESVYDRLKKLNKKIPSAMLEYLGFDD